MRPSPYRHAVGEVLALTPWRGTERIIECHHGYFCAVYIVESIAEPGRRWALKTVRGDRAERKEVCDLFRREASVWSALPYHPAIVQAHEVRSLADLPYLRLEYVEPSEPGAPSLEHLVQRRGRLRWQDVVAIFVQVTDGLAALESRVPAFMHGDLKPSNILIGSGAQAYVTDFGLAALRTELGYNRTSVAGDVYFVAPELYGGSVADVRSDNHSIGVSIVRTLTADSLYKFNVFGRRVRRRVPLPAMPRSLGQLVDSMLCESPQGRPPTYAAVHDALARICESEGIEVVREVPVREILHTISANEEQTRAICAEYHVTEDAARVMLTAIGDAADLRALDRLKESEAMLVRALQVIPDYPGAVAGRAHGWMKAGQLDRAMNAFGAAIAFYLDHPAVMAAERPLFATSCSNFARLAALRADRADMRELADRMSRRGLQEYPDDPRMLRDRAIVQIHTFDPGGAVETLDRATTFAPDDEFIRAARATAELLVITSSNNVDQAAMQAIIGRLNDNETKIVTNLMQSATAVYQKAAEANDEH